MQNKFITWLQLRLDAYGFNPGDIDGIWGRRTMNALKQFQGAHNLRQSGVADADTVRKLRASNIPKLPDKMPRPDLFARFPYMQVGMRKKGLHEKRDNADLRTFLFSDGKTLGDPAVLPWCGDFVETCIALALPNEVLPVNPYLARNWRKFGQECEPCFGAVLVFWRTHKTNSTNGHVGFYVGEDDKNFYVLGGNQSNGISIAKLDKDRLLAARRPLTLPDFEVHKVQMTDNGPVSNNEA